MHPPILDQEPPACALTTSEPEIPGWILSGDVLRSADHVSIFPLFNQPWEHSLLGVSVRSGINH